MDDIIYWGSGSHDPNHHNHCSSSTAPVAYHIHNDIDMEHTKWSMTNSLLPDKSGSVMFDFVAKFRTHFYLLLNRRRRVKKCHYWKSWTVVIVGIVLVYLQLTNGIFQRYFLERDFETEFSYPQDIDNFQQIVQQSIGNKGVPSGLNASVLNLNYSTVPILQTATVISAEDPVGLLIIVKSATYNFKKRISIRRTWGDAKYLKENVIAPGFCTKVAFICGIPKNESDNSNELFQREQQFGDIVFAQFHDAYENNTFKTILAMRWAVEYVKDFKYLMIVDDDMFVNLVNAVSYLKSIPTTLVQAVTSEDSGVTSFYPVHQKKYICPSTPNVSLADKPLMMGNLIVDAKPFRNSLGFGSKWSMSMKKYPFNYFPPYIAGGITILDSKTVAQIYYGSFFTQHFWIDDVYIGIIAHKLGIKLTNNDLMDSSYPYTYSSKMKSEFRNMIGLHGLQCPEQLVYLWNSRDLSSLQDCYCLDELI